MDAMNARVRTAVSQRETRVALLALDGCLTIAVSGLIDAFVMANYWAKQHTGRRHLVVIGIQGTRFHFAEHIGAMFYIAAWFIPWLLLSHAVIFSRLVAPEGAVGLAAVEQS
jgi:hypothetical protein